MHLLLARQVIFQLESWAPVSFVLNVEELDREVVLQVDHCPMVKHNVEVRLLMSSVTPEEEVLRVGVTVKGALEIRMLAIELEIPCYDEESLNQIVYNEDLDQVINSS